MKFLQILMEVALFALSVIELIFVIQLNATVRVPMKITAILIVMIILFVLLVTFEFHESKKNREKTRKVKEDYERKIADLQKKIAEVERKKEAEAAAKREKEMDKPIDVDIIG
ncbi:MAG: hypothetical protein E7186_01390 [Erysipelotrichaceae bacterium]|nr:hypothetical protein [Erysipelotrichaceae bacterium]